MRFSRKDLLIGYHIRRGFLVFALLIFGAAVCAGSRADSPETFKGLELYSWQGSGAWHYALLPGRNALSTRNDVEAAQVADVPKLIELLKEAPRGTYVFWNSHPVPGLVLRIPPSSVQVKINKACKNKHLNLSIGD